MKKTMCIVSLMLVTFCIVGCGNKNSNDNDNSQTETQEKMHKSIEDVMYQLHGNYAVFKTDYTINNKQIWVVFLRDEEIAIFINSNNLQGKVERGLRYGYEIRDNKLRFYNGYEHPGPYNVHDYPETNAEIFLDGECVKFVNMKQYGNRRNIHISAILTNETLSSGCLNFIKKYAQE